MHYLVNICIFISLFFLLLSSSSSATSPDAIAIRVISNPDHYSPIRWYTEKGFSGSPQSLTVDGFEAVRDGRTVYVNAANLSDSDNNGIPDKLYTNIYLISYTQDSESATVDIFGQILSHWKFSTNVSGSGACGKDISIICTYDTECGENGYCNSPKAQIIRDTKRLADLADFDSALESYKDKNGYYPKLSSGSYLPNITISTWPSWQENLGQMLGATLPDDPVNELGDCGNTDYDPITCWNEATQKFADPIPDNGQFDLPEGSSAYVYTSSADGSSYYLDLGIESSGYMGEATTSNKTVNRSPQFTGANMYNGHSGEEYNGYIEASDPDGNSVSWEATSFKYQSTTTGEAIDWSQGDSTSLLAILRDNLLWDSPSVLANTEVKTQKEIYAKKIGKAGIYTFGITINDGKNYANSKVTKDYQFSVFNNVPEIEAISTQTVVIGHSFDMTVKVKDENDSINVDFSYPVNPASPPFNLECSEVQATTEIYKFHCLVSLNQLVAQTQDYTFEATAIDYYGAKSSIIAFTISVQNNKPQITTASLPQATACIGYDLQIAATDPDSHTLSYAATGLPSNLIINPANGKISGIPQAKGSYPVSFTVQDQYYGNTIPPYTAEDNADLNLNVVDENFTVSLSTATITVYTYPTGSTPPLYFGPLQVNATASTDSANTMTYTLQNNPSWLTISSSGVIQGTPTNNTTDPGTFTVTVRATNTCGATVTGNFTLIVKSNQWCGDTVVNGGEECDGGGSCSPSCESIGCAFNQDGSILFNCIISN